MELCGEDAPGVPLLSGLDAGSRGGVGAGVAFALAPSGPLADPGLGASSDNTGKCDGRGSNFSAVDGPVVRDGIAGGTPGVGGGGCFGGATEDAGDGDLGKGGVDDLTAGVPLPSDGGGCLHGVVRACAASTFTEAHGAREMFLCLSREPSRRGLFNGGAVRFPIGICMFGRVPGLSAFGTFVPP